MAAITFQSVSKTFTNARGTFTALDQVSFDIQSGEFFGLLGPNGAGKTTLISILAGLLKSSSGSIKVHDLDVQTQSQQVRKLLGVVPQELVFDPFFTVREALKFQSGYFGVTGNDAWIDELLDNLGLADKANHNMRQLSGGMKRRVLVAQALVHKPPVIVLDEPTAGVDVELRQTLWQFIARLNREGHTVLLTTHLVEKRIQQCAALQTRRATATRTRRASACHRSYRAVPGERCGANRTLLGSGAQRRFGRRRRGNPQSRFGRCVFGCHGSPRMTGWRALFYKEVLRFWKVSAQTIAAPVLTALLYMLIFGHLLEGKVTVYDSVGYTSFLVPGLVMMSVLQNAFANSSSSMVQSKMMGNLVFILLTPLGHWSWFAAYVLAAVVRGFAVGLGVLLVTMWFAPLTAVAPLWILVFALLGASMLGTLGLIAGLWADKFDQMSSFQNFLITPMTFLSGVFYSIHSLPPFWQQVSHFNPFFYMIDGFRYGFFGVSDVSPWISLALVGGANLIVAGIALHLLRTGYKIRG